MPFGNQHLEQLLAPAQLIVQLLSQFRLGQARRRLYRQAKLGNDLCIDPIGLGQRPVALAKSRTWRGLTTAVAIPADTNAATNRRSNPPVASHTTKSGFDVP